MSQEPERATATETLLLQLATDPIHLARKGVDLSRLGVIREEEERGLIWAKMRYKMGSRWFGWLHETVLNHSVGRGGRGRIDTLKGASVSLGGAVNTEADLVKPNWVVRNIIDKNWEERQRMELGLPQRTE